MPFDPEDPDHQEQLERVNQGIALEQAGQEDQAVELYESVIAANYPGDWPYKALATIYHRRGDSDNEIRVLEEGIAAFEQEALALGIKEENKVKVRGFQQRLGDALRRRYALAGTNLVEQWQPDTAEYGGERNIIELGELPDGWSYQLSELCSSKGGPPRYEFIVGVGYSPRSRNAKGISAPVALPTLEAARAAAGGFFLALRREPGFPDITLMQR